MTKQKRVPDIGYRERLLGAKGFDYRIFAKPRHFTHHMSSLVCYPKLINDIGRTVDVRRVDDKHLSFELHQKRYLGRGTYIISARARGLISYDEVNEKTQISGFVQIGGRYVILLTFMTIIVLLSLGLLAFTILFLPIALLMLAVIGLHWSYLFADRNDLGQQLAHLVDLTERSERLEDRELIQQNQQIENEVESARLEQSK